MKYKTTISLIVLAAVYALIFLPGPLVEWLKGQFGSLGRWSTIIGFPTLASLLSLLLFAQDPLATGTSSSAVYFRSEFPSAFIRQHYTCSREQADGLWFRIFDRWGDAHHPQHLDYVKTFERSYGCRFVYYLSRALALFAVLSLVTLLANFAIQQSKLDWTQVYIGVLLIAAAAATSVGLFLGNRIPRGAGSEPTGCWRKWRETNGVIRNWLQENLFKRAAAYDDAYKLAPTL